MQGSTIGYAIVTIVNTIIYSIVAYFPIVLL